MGSQYTKPFPLMSLESLIKTHKVDVSPSYQRGSVWTKPQKKLLIDSVLRNYDIPKLYFRKISRKPFEFEVVDGHQRLDSIFEFFNNEFSLPSDADAIDGKKIADLDFASLPTEIQLQFQSATFDVVVLENYSDDEIDDMFARFQNGTPLNAAEKRRVIPGNMRTVVAGRRQLS